MAKCKRKCGGGVEKCVIGCGRGKGRCGERYGGVGKCVGSGRVVEGVEKCG